MSTRSAKPLPCLDPVPDVFDELFFYYFLILNSPLSDYRSGERGRSFGKEDLCSNSGYALSDYIFPSPPNTPDEGRLLEVCVHILVSACCYSDVFSRSARSWWPHLLAKVTGVSPSAFFI